MMYLQHVQVNTAIGTLTFELPDFHCFKFQLQSLLFFFFSLHLLALVSFEKQEE